MKRIAWFLGVSTTAVALIGSGLWLYLRRSLPVLSGDVEVHGIAAAVEIVRDRDAIPHVYAESEGDAAHALGYVHAQDRMWQLELNRRLGSGRLSELFGEQTLAQDRFYRTIGLGRSASENVAHLDATTRALLEAYAAGVNAYLAERSGSLGPEFDLLGVQPEPWTSADSVTVLKVMAWTLSTNWSRELRRVMLSNRLSPRQLAEFLGDDPTHPLDLRELYGAMDRTAAHLLARAPHAIDAPIGSNNWVIAGTRSESGRPLLANDPHLDMTAPSLWYLAHLRTGELNVIGATIPGIPGVILGRNDHVAWAFTNTDSDTQDLFVERLVEGDPDRYLTPDGSDAFVRRSEIIRVKGKADEQLTVRVSRHGPVISDVHAAASAHAPPHHVLALSAAALRTDDTTMQFPSKAARARDAQALYAAASDFHAPQQNVVYADDRGSIGFVAAGRVPVRAEDNELRGLAPAPGWMARYDWRDFIPFDELPQQTDPPSSRLVTANQDIRPPGYRHWITSEWSPPYRADRIAHLLDQQPLHTLESFAAIQGDVRSGIAPGLLPRLLSTQPANSEQGAALIALRSWSYEMRTDRPEPLIFSTWIRELSRAVYEDELGDDFAALWDESPEFLARVLAAEDGLERWCDDVRTPGVEPCAQRLQISLAQTVGYLRAHYGTRPEAWTWGAAHQTRSKHTPFSSIAWLAPWFDIVTPTPGSNDTVNLSGYAINDARAPFESRYGAGYRALYDLGAPEQSRFVISTGQSGHVLSPHYRSMLERWASGQYAPMQTERAKVMRDALGTLMLKPARTARH